MADDRDFVLAIADRGDGEAVLHANFMPAKFSTLLLQPRLSCYFLAVDIFPHATAASDFVRLLLVDSQPPLPDEYLRTASDKIFVRP